MTTATTNNEWKPFEVTTEFGFESHSLLLPGDLLSFHDGRQGTFIRKLRKNLEVEIDGQTWRCKPRGIARYKRGNGLQPSSLKLVKETKVKSDSQRLFQECKVGDIALFWRQKFDVVKIIELTPRLRCKALDGRGKGKIYGYKANWYVQKLDGDRISV